MKTIKTLYERDLYPEIADAQQTEMGRELLENAAARLSRGEISRRSFLWAAGAIAALASTRSQAASGEIVFANWGGPAREFYKTIYGAPFEKKSGLTVVIDGAGPLPSKVKAMVDAKATTWDIIDSDSAKALVLGRAGLLEPIDYSIVDRAKMPPGGAFEHFASGYYLANVLTYDTAKLKKAPTGWKDFWDTANFPGMRCVRKQPDGQMEICMIAAGKSIKDVYPVDFTIVKAKIKELKQNLIAWSSGSQSQEMFQNGEVVMGNLWHTRVSLINRESKGRFAWTWNEGVLLNSGWAVPRNNPAGRDAAMRLIASMQDVDQQVQMLRAMGSGPVNPAAAAAVPDDLKMFDPGQPAHKAVSIIHNPEWYDAPSGVRNATNDEYAREIWLDALS